MQPKKKIRSRHKVNVKKERQKQKKIVEKKQKKVQKQTDTKIIKIKQKPIKESALDIRLEKETKLYWIRAVTGVIGVIILRLIGFVGWLLLIWMLVLMFLFPFAINYTLGYKLDKEEWTWKNVLKPGLGVFFFMFMIFGVIMHTSLVLIGEATGIYWYISWTGFHF
jgi:Flp pilus assembly protein TadB